MRGKLRRRLLLYLLDSPGCSYALCKAMDDMTFMIAMNDRRREEKTRGKGKGSKARLVMMNEQANSNTVSRISM